MLVSNQGILSQQKHGHHDNTRAELNDDEDQICHFRRVHIFYQQYVQDSLKKSVGSEISKLESHIPEFMRRHGSRASLGLISDEMLREMLREKMANRRCLDICSKVQDLIDVERDK